MKKFLCLFTCMIICLSTTVFASTTLTDIKGEKYEDAVEKLVYFGIVNGYEGNVYMPENDVTRAELSKMIVLALGKEDKVESAKNKFLNFSDVLSNYWGYGYIKVATDENIVNGYTDGTFKPNGKVTYAEATTMVLRALGYKEAIENSNNTLKWPDNYMVYADEKLELFEKMGEFKASDPANRGDIAILIWNALRTGVCDIVGENSKGLVYGEGTPMVTEYLGYTYIENAEVVDIEFDDNFVNAEVTFDVGTKKNKTMTFKAEDVLEMYGSKVTVLINDKKDEIIEIECTTEYKKVEGSVSNITDKKIYLANKRNGYSRPDDDNILLYGIESLEEAAEVILLLDGSSVEYCIAKGSTDVYVGIVINDNVEVDDDEYGIKVREVDATKGGKSYIVSSEDDWPDKNDIILYFINSEDYLVVLENIKLEDASTIAGLTDEYLKISRKEYYEFEDEDDYTVFIINGSRVKSADLDDINTSNDMVKVVTYNGHMYFFIFDDAVLDNIDESTADALELLEEAIDDAEALDEAECTQESYSILMDALKTAKSIDHTYSVKKINNATKKLNSALDDMEKVKSKEKKIVALKKELRAYVVDEAEDIIEDEDKYTSKSYTNFYNAYEDAEEVLAMLAATYDEVEEAYENLEDAIDSLVKRK